jgi:hypothetical protein
MVSTKFKIENICLFSTKSAQGADRSVPWAVGIEVICLISSRKEIKIDVFSANECRHHRKTWSDIPPPAGRPLERNTADESDPCSN